MEIRTIGLDLAKQVFQIHGVNEAGGVVVKRRLRRARVISYFASLPACLIGIEACATAHFWARKLRSLGHEVRLMPPQYVKAYVKRGKNDAADAAAICEAVTRPSMRFVPGQDRRATVGLDHAPGPRAAGPAANPADQRGPRAPGRVRSGRGPGALERATAFGEHAGGSARAGARASSPRAPCGSARRGGSTARRGRCSDHGLAQGPPCQPAARHHPRRRAADRHRHRRHRA
jgi:hypothetical protein